MKPSFMAATSDHHPHPFPSITIFISFIYPFFLFIVYLSTVDFANADPRFDVVSWSCTDHKLGNDTLYASAYWRLVDGMREDLARSKFSVREEGEDPERLHVLGQCNEDLSPEDCNGCIDNIKLLMPLCFPATGGRIYSDGCFIRADNYDFYQETTTNDDIKKCSDDIEELREFNISTIKVIEKAAMRAANSVDFAAEHLKYCDKASVYALANCWKSLDAHMCAACLTNAAKASIGCLPSTEGRVLNAGCILRYSGYQYSKVEKRTEQKGTVVLYMAYSIVGIVIGAGALLIGFSYLKITHERNERRRKLKGRMQVYPSILKRNLQLLHFQFSALDKATDCFSEAHKLGQGGGGEIFKGTLPDGREIAVKRLFTDQMEKVYTEIDIVSRVQHKNLHRLLGCCFTTTTSFLVYEFLANSSLDHVLFDPEKKKELNWKKRRGIIIGITEGLEYLHSEEQGKIIHRDIKAGNILLDLKYRPKISDFGLAKFQSRDEKTTAIAGTLGYMAPEYLARGRLTEKVDVYSYGVLVLEIVSGHRNNKSETQESLVTRAWVHFESKTTEDIIDKSMEAIDENVEEMKKFVQVGLLCTQETPSSRPSMKQVFQLLRRKYNEELPIPSKPPFIEESLE